MNGPVHELQTERLTLRPLDDADVAALVRHWGDAEVRRYLWDDKPVTDEMVSAVVTTSNRDFRDAGYGIWAVCFKGEGALLGMCGLRKVQGQPHVEILFSLRPRYWRQGLATEAARAVLQYAFEELGMTEIVASFDAGNVSSGGVLQRLGMSPLPAAEQVPGKPERWRVTRDRFRSWSVPPPSVFPPPR